MTERTKCCKCGREIADLDVIHTAVGYDLCQDCSRRLAAQAAVYGAMI